MVTGRLSGTLDGQPVSLEATGSEMLLTLPSVRLALRRRGSLAQLNGLRGVLRFTKVGLSVKAGGLPRLRVAPEPHPVVRLFLPAAE